jgi:hypothetical protein
MKQSVILHSTLTPVARADALHRSIDEERRTLFALSGYRGSCPVLGEVTESTFRVQKRRYWRNDFAPHLYGEFQPEAGGSRIEAHFDMSRWVKTFMRIWLAGVVLLGGADFRAICSRPPHREPSHIWRQSRRSDSPSSDDPVEVLATEDRALVWARR